MHTSNNFAVVLRSVLVIGETLGNDSNIWPCKNDILERLHSLDLGFHVLPCIPDSKANEKSDSGLPDIGRDTARKI